MKKEIGKSASQTMVIETPQLLVKGNIMSWYGTMIQLSNISCISTRPMAQKDFPVLSLGLLLIGALLIKYNMLMSIIFWIAGVIWIYIWYGTNMNRKMNTVLSLIMNSGDNLQVVITNRDFLDKVLKVLEQIIIDGGVGKDNVAINIQGCTFSGDAKVLNDLKLSQGEFYYGNRN